MRKLKYKSKKCFYCEKTFKKDEHPSILAVDIPYMNIPFHEDCVKKVKNYGEEKYLQENNKKIVKWAKEQKNV